MRIIAGEFRGRRLLAPANHATRPITDRVKQSVFDILAPLIPDSIVFDVFAGTGSMGLECLSRSASFVYFFEKERSAVELLKKNVAALGVADRSQVVSGDVFLWFAKQSAQKKANLVFLDPPYRFLNEKPAELQKLVENWQRGFLADDAMVVFRHDTSDTLEFPGLQCIDQRNYGGMTVQFLK